MQQAVQNAGSPLERNITVSVPIAQIEAEIATRLKRLARTVRMQGFRPGHVPLKMVERQYGFQVRQEVVSDAVQKTFAEAVKDQNYRVAGYPRFQPKPVASEGATDVEYTAIFEVYPEVVMGDVASRKVSAAGHEGRGPQRRGHAADAAQAAREVRARGARRGRRRSREHRLRGPHRRPAVRGQQGRQLHRGPGRAPHAAGLRGGHRGHEGGRAEDLSAHLPAGLRRCGEGQDGGFHRHREPGRGAAASRSWTPTSPGRWASRTATWTGSSARCARTWRRRSPSA